MQQPTTKIFGKALFVLAALGVIGGVAWVSKNSGGELFQGRLNIDQQNVVGEKVKYPDIEVESSSIVVDPEMPKVGGVLNVTMTVKNSGDADVTDSFGINAVLGGLEESKMTVNGLKAGQEQNVYINFDIGLNNPWRNTATLVIELDPEDIINESNESNNLAQRIVKISQ